LVAVESAGVDGSGGLVAAVGLQGYFKMTVRDNSSLYAVMK
jgi:hypothetical protein